jgi:hypothetical protein
MKRWAVFYGGSSYSAPYARDAKEFHSLKAVKNRYYWALHDEDREFPAVNTERAMVVVWNRCPHEEFDPYPDLVITVGPRGGLIIHEA